MEINNTENSNKQQFQKKHISEIIFFLSYLLKIKKKKRKVCQSKKEQTKTNQ